MSKSLTLKRNWSILSHLYLSANADGGRRQTSKMKLMKVLESIMSSEPSNCYTNSPKTGVGAYIVDFIAHLRTLVEIPNTFEELGWKLLKSIPSGYSRVDFVADTYRTARRPREETEEFLRRS